jgi:hypothetical protein
MSVNKTVIRVRFELTDLSKVVRAAQGELALATLGRFKRTAFPTRHLIKNAHSAASEDAGLVVGALPDRVRRPLVYPPALSCGQLYWCFLLLWDTQRNLLRLTECQQCRAIVLRQFPFLHTDHQGVRNLLESFG